MTFKELQDNLGKSIDDLIVKKSEMDKAQAALNTASANYSKAMDVAKDAKSKVEEAMGAIGLGSNDRVRVSG